MRGRMKRKRSRMEKSSLSGKERGSSVMERGDACDASRRTPTSEVNTEHANVELGASPRPLAALLALDSVDVPRNVHNYPEQRAPHESQGDLCDNDVSTANTSNPLRGFQELFTLLLLLLRCPLCGEMYTSSSSSNAGQTEPLFSTAYNVLQTVGDSEGGRSEGKGEKLEPLRSVKLSGAFVSEGRGCKGKGRRNRSQVRDHSAAVLNTCGHTFCYDCINRGIEYGCVSLKEEADFQRCEKGEKEEHFHSSVGDARRDSAIREGEEAGREVTVGAALSVPLSRRVAYYQFINETLRRHIQGPVNMQSGEKNTNAKRKAYGEEMERNEQDKSGEGRSGTIIKREQELEEGQGKQQVAEQQSTIGDVRNGALHGKWRSCAKSFVPRKRKFVCPICHTPAFKWMLVKMPLIDSLSESLKQSTELQDVWDAGGDAVVDAVVRRQWGMMSSREMVPVQMQTMSKAQDQGWMERVKDEEEDVALVSGGRGEEEVGKDEGMLFAPYSEIVSGKGEAIGGEAKVPCTDSENAEFTVLCLSSSAPPPRPTSPLSTFSLQSIVPFADVAEGILINGPDHSGSGRCTGSSVGTSPSTTTLSTISEVSCSSSCTSKSNSQHYRVRVRRRKRRVPPSALHLDGEGGAHTHLEDEWASSHHLPGQANGSIVRRTADSEHPEESGCSCGGGCGPECTLIPAQIAPVQHCVGNGRDRGRDDHDRSARPHHPVYSLGETQVLCHQRCTVEEQEQQVVLPPDDHLPNASPLSSSSRFPQFWRCASSLPHVLATYSSVASTTATLHY